ncbi:MAG: hypothetical protein K0Q49_1137 [Haloplasmataceae bacterium]|jgi:hypothetical protein|nr:hypothetical protein [Haloplasmataceae bacterium]
MVVVGMISFITELILPSGMFGHKIYTFDVLRYYYAHLIIFLAPCLMVITKQHQLSYRRILKVPFVFFGVLIIILFNEVVLIAIGLLNSDINTLLNPNIRNTALIFGFPDAYSKFDWLIQIFVPKLFRTIPFGESAGQEMFWPVIWQVIPAYQLICFIVFLQCYIFNKINKAES